MSPRISVAALLLAGAFASRRKFTVETTLNDARSALEAEDVAVDVLGPRRELRSALLGMQGPEGPRHQVTVGGGAGATVAAPLVRMEPMVHADPLVVAAVVFSSLAAVYFCSLQFSTWSEKSRNEVRREEIRLARDMLYERASSVLKPLAAIEQDSAIAVQLLFKEKLLGLIQALGRNPRWESPGQSTHIPLYWHRCLMAWLHAFEECSMDPGSDPLILCNDFPYQPGVTSLEITQRVYKELEEKIDRTPKLGACEAFAARAFLQKTSQELLLVMDTQPKHQWVELVCPLSVRWAFDKVDFFPVHVQVLCMRFVIGSTWHLRMLMCVLLGFTLAVILHASGRHFFAACVDLSVGLIMVLLLKVGTFLESARLHREALRMAAMEAEVTSAEAKGSHWVAKHQQILSLWKQTINKLDFFGEMHRAAESVEDFEHGSGCDDPLEELFRKCTEVAEGFATPESYLASTPKQEAQLSVANDAVKLTIGRLREAVDHRKKEELMGCLGNFFGFLVVRVVSGHNLAKPTHRLAGQDVHKVPSIGRGRQSRQSRRADQDDQLDAHVAVFLGQAGGGGSEMITQTIPDAVNPKWEEDVLLITAAGEQTVTLEVRDSSGSSIGYVAVPLRGEDGPHAGQWVDKLMPLMRAEAAHHSRDAAGSLEFQLFLGTSIKQFAELGRARSSAD